MISVVHLYTGLGLETAKKLAKTPGHICILTSRDPSNGAKAIKEMQEEGLEPVYKQLDIGDPASVEVGAMIGVHCVFLTCLGVQIRAGNLALGCMGSAA